jgi:hypothetical protein
MSALARHYRLKLVRRCQLWWAACLDGVKSGISLRRITGLCIAFWAGQFFQVGLRKTSDVMFLIAAVLLP